MGVHIGPDGIRKGKIIIVKRDPTKDFNHEIIERKGLGHPDTIADVLASKISQNYSEYTVNNCDGKVLHHQIDKLMVIGGKTDLSWGGGRFVKPVKIIVAGRISKTYLREELPVDNIVRRTIEEYFRENFPLLNLDTDLVIQMELSTSPGPGTIKESKGAIATMFNPTSKGAIRGYENLVANDTSFCVYYAPYSLLENTVLEIEGFLNAPETKKKFLWLGSDIKIMAVRNFRGIDMTICVPQIAKYVHSLQEYHTNLKLVSKEIMKLLLKYYDETEISLSINTKDDYEKNNVYLTLTGASLSGDIGVVGRGNRLNGLITANRTMSLEGMSGKNPRYYSGFIYNVLARRIATRIYEKTKMPCEVGIVSQNGGDLLNPWRLVVKTDFDQETVIKRIIQGEFEKIPQITEAFIKGEIKTC